MPPKDDDPGSQKTVSAICALGSQDNCVSIWYTANAKSLAVTQNIFNYAVLDMDWSRDGLNLYMSSYDGTVACLCFEENEFGTPLNSEETVNE
jgi:protein HIRA/HIR1